MLKPTNYSCLLSTTHSILSHFMSHCLAIRIQSISLYCMILADGNCSWATARCITRIVATCGQFMRDQHAYSMANRPMMAKHFDGHLNYYCCWGYRSYCSHYYFGSVGRASLRRLVSMLVAVLVPVCMWMLNQSHKWFHHYVLVK